MNLKEIKSLEDVTVVEFRHDFYIEKFRDIRMSDEEKSLFSLRLCAFIDLGEEVNKANIPFS
jgi:hypothetical protein